MSCLQQLVLDNWEAKWGVFKDGKWERRDK
jgi:hypothetical protein